MLVLSLSYALIMCCSISLTSLHLEVGQSCILYTVNKKHTCIYIYIYIIISILKSSAFGPQLMGSNGVRIPFAHEQKTQHVLKLYGVFKTRTYHIIICCFKNHRTTAVSILNNKSNLKKTRIE